jgi:hypothetical protein
VGRRYRLIAGGFQFGCRHLQCGFTHRGVPGDLMTSLAEAVTLQNSKCQ